MSEKRTSEYELYKSLARLVSQRSTCLHRKTGAIIVNSSGRILSFGYNGAPSGMEHCDSIGCARSKFKPGQRLDLCRAVHAELNAIINAAKEGIKIDKSIMYCTHLPCHECAKAVINAGIKGVYYIEEYPSDAKELFNQASIYYDTIDKLLTEVEE